MKIEITLNIHEIAAITKVEKILVEKFKLPVKKSFLNNGDYDFDNGTIHAKYTHFIDQSYVLDYAEVVEAISDKAVRILDVARSLFFLFKEFNNDFAMKLEEIRVRREKAHRNEEKDSRGEGEWYGHFTKAPNFTEKQ